MPSSEKKKESFPEKDSLLEPQASITSPEDRELVWKPLKVEHLVQDRWIDFRRVEYELPDGSAFAPFYNYSRRSYVVIVASDEEGKFLCVRQYRHGIREVTTEFPAGGIEQAGPMAASAAESTLEAAKRELREETGCESDIWTHLISIPSCASICDNYAHVYRAENCRKVADLHLDDTEFLKVHRYTAEELDTLIREGKFQQSVHVMAWLLAKEQAESGKSGSQTCE